VKTCDICGKDAKYLDTIRDQYQTDGIKDICDECRREVNDHLSKLQLLSSKMNEHWLKKFMKNLALKK